MSGEPKPVQTSPVVLGVLALSVAFDARASSVMQLVVQPSDSTISAVPSAFTESDTQPVLLAQVDALPLSETTVVVLELPVPMWTVPNCPAKSPTNPASQEADILVAENAFWHSPALQSDFAQMWVKVAQAVGHPYFLMGYDILNEPGPGLIPNEIFEQGYLAPFYRAVGTALRTVDPGGLLFVEPSILNGAVNGSSQFLTPIGLPRVVYEPHQYGAVSFNADAVVGVGDVAGPDQFVPDLTIDLAVAKRMGAAVWLGEWGAINPAVSFRPTQYVIDDLTEQDRFMLGSAYWSYDSSLSGPNTAIGAQLIRITPDAIAGTPLTIETGTSAMTMSWRSSGGQTLVSYPAGCTPDADVLSGSAPWQVIPGGYVSLTPPADQVVAVRVSCS